MLEADTANGIMNEYFLKDEFKKVTKHGFTLHSLQCA